MSIVFFGSSKFVIPILEVLRKNFNLSLVITTEHLASQGLAWEAPVIKYCVKNKIPYVSLKQFNNLTIRQLKKVNASVGVLADFGLIIPGQILSLFPKGIVNIHPSLLPKYRGPTPVQTAILNGEKTTGVSIMKLDDKIDHGPILSQEKEDILETDTAASLYKRLFEKGSILLLKILPDYLNGSLNPTPQNHKEATLTKPLTRADGFIDPATLNSQFSTLNLNLKIRAYFPWPGVWTKLNLKTIKFLPENLIQVEGKKPMNYKDFVNGYSRGKELLSKLNLL